MALLGAFDFLKKQEDFFALGMTDVYEKFAYDVGLAATTQRGDVFTMEKAATDGMPSNDAGNPAGGYAPASYRAKNNRLIVEMAPVGAASATYPALCNGVYFLDKDGNELFRHSSTAKFKNRATGAITVATTVEPEDFAANADKVDALWFFAQDYTLLEDQAMDISLRGSADIWD